MFKRSIENLLNSTFITPDGAGAGGGGAAGGPAGGAAAAPAAANNAGGAGDPSGTGGEAAAAAAAAAAANYWPEGLDQSFKGADSKATLDNLAKRLGENAKALDGYRKADSARDVVKTFEEMVDFSKVADFKIDERNQPFFEQLKTDPVFKPVAEVAIAEGIGRRSLGRLYQALLNSGSQAGLLEPPLDVKAERTALLPDAAKNLAQPEQDAAIDKRMNENFDFLKLAATNLGLPKEAQEYAELMLGDAAKGHQFFEWVRGLAQAKGAGPGAHGQGAQGGDTRESLKAELAALEAGPKGPDYAKKHAELQAKYQKLLGEA